MDDEELRTRIARGSKAMHAHERAAAVVVALTSDEQDDPDPHVVLEVRASTLAQQPGEVCCPGGHVETGELPEEAAVREACEELLVTPRQVSLLGDLGALSGPGGLPLHVFVARLHDYRGTFSNDEVASVFTLPVSWLVGHDPKVYAVRYDPTPPADFPWEKIEDGRAYQWRPRYEEIPFYDTDPVVWGATARVLQRFSRALRGKA